MSAAAPLDPDVEARLTALLFRNSLLSTSVNVAVSAAVTLLGLLGQPGRVMLAWWAVMLAAALLRQSVAWSYARSAPGPEHAPAWRRRYQLGTMGVGLIWLAGTSAVMWHNDPQVRMLASLALIGLVAGAVPVLGMVREVYRGYAIPLCVGIAAVTALEGQDAAHWIFVVFVLVFLAAELRSANFLHRTLVDAFSLEIERGRMLGSLEQARADAEAANIAKTQFLATMSHELRTPLNGLLGMAELLCEPEVSEDERKEYAQIILSSGRALLALLNDILDLSKVEAGRLEIALADFQPAPLLEELAVLFSEPARAKGVQISAQWEGAAQAQYVSDPIRVRQMVTNLVANAVKFTDRGSVRIEGRELRREGAVAELEFSVEDTGMGIAPDKLALLFRPFSQVDNSNARRAGGTGLGLSIVRRLAQLMEGEAGVTSTPGKGSRFWVRIRATRISP